jgi:hypothetical protein
MRTVLFAALLALGIAGALPAQTQPLLQLQGQPYFGGSMTLHLTGTVGQPALLAYGLNPLIAPIQTGKGPWYIGSLVNLVPMGSIPSGGLVNLAFTMPPVAPSLVGISIALQGYVSPQLSNAATISLDHAYLEPATGVALESPEPALKAFFGDRVAVGDLNADNADDIIVGAWQQPITGVLGAGSVYIFWGPLAAAYTRLEPVTPQLNANFGIGLLVEDLDLDGTDDLVVCEASGAPTPPGGHGKLHVFWGGTAFPSQSGLDIDSVGTGDEYSNFGRSITHGDYNADGWPDIAVGADLVTVAGQAQAGSLYVYWGPSYSACNEVISPDSGPSAYFGSGLATGDVNGDSIDDLVEGSGRDDSAGTTNLGSVHVFEGPNLQWHATIHAPANLGLNTRFGESVAVADLNHDGLADVLASDQKNHVYIFQAPALDAVATIHKPPVDGALPSGVTSFGWAYVAAMDVNADGGLDIVIPDGEGVLQGCGLLGPEGQVYVALYPYYATFFTLSEPVPNCGDAFGGAAVMRAQPQGVVQAVLGAPGFDVPGNQNAGLVWVFGF